MTDDGNVSKGDVEWMLKKLVSGERRITARCRAGSSIPKMRREWKKTGVIKDFHVLRHEGRSGEDPWYEVWLTFDDGEKKHADGLTQFADDFYGMHNGWGPPADRVLRFEEA